MTDTEIFERNLLPFKIVKRYGTRAQCRCPAHDDKHASLTITKGRKCTLFYCHAGCSVDDILQSAGLEKKETFYEDKPQKSDWRFYVENREGRKIESVYNYVSSINGEYAFTKIRLAGKKLLYGILQNQRFSYGLGGKRRQELKSLYFSPQEVQKAISEGNYVFYVEGEKDANTLKSKGYTAVTAGGVNDWQSDFAQAFKGAKMIILADNDEPGKRLANTVQSDLTGVPKV